MTSLSLEHVNITVSHPDRTARLMHALFDWRIRWRGPALKDGQTIHVGVDDRCLALFTQPEATYSAGGFAKGAPLDHTGIVVDDLDEAEARVRAAGLTPSTAPTTGQAGVSISSTTTRSNMSWSALHDVSMTL